jgi:hypothetical protein
MHLNIMVMSLIRGIKVNLAGTTRRPGRDFTLGYGLIHCSRNIHSARLTFSFLTSSWLSSSKGILIDLIIFKSLMLMYM